MLPIIVLALALPATDPMPIRDPDWRLRNTLLQLALVAEMAVDIGQSKWAQVHWGSSEGNPFLPMQPSMGEFVVGAGIALILESVGTVVFDSPYREAWQAAWVGAEFSNIVNNGGYFMAIGFHMQFSGG